MTPTQAFHVDGKMIAALPLGDKQSCKAGALCVVSGFGALEVYISWVETTWQLLCSKIHFSKLIFILLLQNQVDYPSINRLYYTTLTVLDAKNCSFLEKPNEYHICAGSLSVSSWLINGFISFLKNTFFENQLIKYMLKTFHCYSKISSYGEAAWKTHEWWFKCKIIYSVFDLTQVLSDCKCTTFVHSSHCLPRTARTEDFKSVERILPSSWIQQQLLQNLVLIFNK